MRNICSLYAYDTCICVNIRVWEAEAIKEQARKRDAKLNQSQNCMLLKCKINHLPKQNYAIHTLVKMEEEKKHAK